MHVRHLLWEEHQAEVRSSEAQRGHEGLSAAENGGGHWGRGLGGHGQNSEFLVTDGKSRVLNRGVT